MNDKRAKVVRTTIIVPDEVREYAKKNRITISKLVILGYQYLKEKDDILLSIKREIEEIKKLLQELYTRVTKT